MGLRRADIWIDEILPGCTLAGICPRRMAAVATGVAPKGCRWPTTAGDQPCGIFSRARM